MNEITEALRSLHSELDRLRPAIEYLDAAKAAIDAAGKIPAQHQHQLDEHLSQVEQRLGASEEQLAVTAKSYADESASLLSNLQQRITAAETQLATVASDWSDKSQVLSDSLKQQHERVGETVVERTVPLVSVQKSIEAYYDRLAAIDFPTRLDKLDVSVTGIQSGLQTTQQRVDLLEQSVKQGIVNIEQQITSLKQLIKKKLNVALSVSVGLSVVVLILLVFTLLK